MVELGRGAVAAGDDEDSVEVSRRKSEMHSTDVIFVTQLVVHVNHIEGTLITDDVILALFNKRESVLMLEDQLAVVLFELFVSSLIVI